MKYKKRKSESVTEQIIVEYLQNGILLKFNIIESINEEGIIQYCYDEF